ncbi:TRM11 family SAM-dependent methyltransferase [Actinokineospora terrae]|uniref:Methyltransferase n=1 Tax=Actinokineospora terrae TaxID=155974 RepID=A0A1H9WR35_9PSEU|nr:DNA methyltransferase [Actinokineospora terrae]SES36378.1 DNA methylase [Actinokineospora terrae]
MNRTPNPAPNGALAHPGLHRQEGTPVTHDATHQPATEPSATTAAAVGDEPTQRIPRALIAALDTPPTAVDNSVDSGERKDGAEPPAVSVWTTAQTSPAAQRKNKYTPESTAHPAKMLPEVVRHAVTHYTRPGELVLDPMCGIGTTLVEAVRLGRRAVGVEYEPHWVEVANANLDVAREQSVGGDKGIDARVFHGDARQLVTLLPPEYVGQAALVVTSPPYGPSTHGQVSVAPGEGVQKYHHLYGNTLDRGNLANIGHHRLLAGFTRILAALRTFLKPGGHIAITIRPWREHAELIDLPSQILACGRTAGLIPVERNVALLARAAETDLVARGSFFQRDFIRKQREAGLPLHLIAHEDVLVFRTGLRESVGSSAPGTSAGDVVDLARYRSRRSAGAARSSAGERGQAA